MKERNYFVHSCSLLEKPALYNGKYCGENELVLICVYLSSHGIANT